VIARKSSRESYAEGLTAFSTRIIAAQTPIRILHAITWPDWVRRRFFEQHAEELPSFEYPGLRYDVPAVQREFRGIERDLDASDPVHRILRETSEQYSRVTEMLSARGTARFHQISRELYGAPADPLLDRATTSLDLARHLGEALGGGQRLGPPEEGRISDEEAASILRGRLGRFFKEDSVVVKVSARLTVDAAAGANNLKVKRGSLFTRRVLK